MAKVLVIEDEKLALKNLFKILSAEGFEVIGAENGMQGIELAIKEEPNLIICDIMMPDLDGYQVLTSLREEPNTSLIPFIFLTAKNERADIRQGMNLGADDYLMKPFEVDELLEAIAARFKRQALLEQHLHLLIEEKQQQLAGKVTEKDVVYLHRWDIEKLYKDLALVKQQQKVASRKVELTPLEKVCLLGILNGQSPSYIAEQINREPKGLAVDLSRGLYRYIEALTGKQPKNWRDIPLLLSNLGYQSAIA